MFHWFYVIHPGPRFIITLYLPWIFTSGFLIGRWYASPTMSFAAQGSAETVAAPAGRARVEVLASVAIGLLLAYDLPVLLLHEVHRQSWAGW
jgi:hypothetical protein